MFDLAKIQAGLAELSFDGWLLFDFRGSNVLARRVLQIPPDAHLSRRWAYWIPRQGEPRKLVHRIEPGSLDHLPGEKNVYMRWEEFEAGMASLVNGSRVVAMEYSPRGAIPYVSRVDAGTVELVRGAGVEVVSSGDLVQLFEAVWDESQWQSHLHAGQHTNSAYARAWNFIRQEVTERGHTTESAVQREILQHFAEHGLVTDSPPSVAVNANSGDPHYSTSHAEIRAGDFVLIDLWAKLAQPRAVYSDLTRVGFVGTEVPARFQEIFAIVARARDAAIAKVREACAAMTPLRGWEVDVASRSVIEAAGYGQAFVHRTGHSIGQEVHGNGANIDSLETRDERLILPGCCFSIEPGIYLPEFGARSEVNVYVSPAREIHVTAGELQHSVLAILDQRHSFG